MAKKTEISCIECNADFEVLHEMGSTYSPKFCCFCGEEIVDDDYMYCEDEEDDDEDG